MAGSSGHSSGSNSHACRLNELDLFETAVHVVHDKLDPPLNGRAFGLGIC